MNYFNQAYIAPKYEDGWKSPWRIDFERRNAEEAKRPSLKRLCLVTPLPKPKRVRAPRPKVEPAPLCECGRKKKRESEICWRCSALHVNDDRIECAEDNCTALLQRNNRLGKCLAHAAKLRSTRANAARKERKSKEQQ